MIIFTCPVCGHDLRHEVLASYPPINKDYCPKCGWTHEEQEEVVRVPFKTNNLDDSSMNNYLSSICNSCPNNRKNGGSGICHCILGSNITY